MASWAKLQIQRLPAMLELETNRRQSSPAVEQTAVASSPVVVVVAGWSCRSVVAPALVEIRDAGQIQDVQIREVGGRKAQSCCCCC